LESGVGEGHDALPRAEGGASPTPTTSC
jgi:hypothetical protein